MPGPAGQAVPLGLSWSCPRPAYFTAAGSELTAPALRRQDGSPRAPSPAAQEVRAAMGRGTPLSCLGPACCLLLLLLGDNGGLGSSGKQRGLLEERQSSVTEAAPWGRARYEAVKKQLGTVGALSKQYWQYLACKVWHEGCGKEERTSPGPGKLLILLCLGSSGGVCTPSTHEFCGKGLLIVQHALCWGGKSAHAHPGSVSGAPVCHGASCSSLSFSPSASLHLGRVAVNLGTPGCLCTVRE